MRKSRRHVGRKRTLNRRVLGQEICRQREVSAGVGDERGCAVSALVLGDGPEIVGAIGVAGRLGLDIARVGTTGGLLRAMGLGADVVAVDEASLGSPVEWAGVMARARGAGVSVVILTGKATALVEARARRLGAMGVCEVGACPETAGHELGAVLLAAALHSRALKERKAGPHRWNNARDRASRGVSGAVEVVAPQCGSKFSDVQAGPRRSPDMSQLSIANEFKGMISNELDIEALLRTTLEFVLARSGPTNAAIFLPTTSGDYSLGAYVNYDCPKDTCDILLDHMANVVAPKFERQTSVAYMTTPSELKRRIGEDAAWLGDSGVVAFACKHDNETLAIFLLFRDRRTVYPASVLEQLRTVGDLFAAQLARVIHIHHRHLPKEKWGMLGDSSTEGESDGYGDLAA